MKKISSVSRFTAPLLALTLVLAACAVPAKRYLAVAPSEPVDDNNPAMAVVLLHPFTEDFATDGQLGLHRLHGNRQTKLLVNPGRIGHALDAMLLQKLASKQIAAARDGGGWNQTPEGLDAFNEPNQLLISGRITRFTINVNETLLSGKAHAEMDVECVLGLIKDKKVIHRNVHVAQEMVTVSFNRQDLEKILMNCLTAASNEILAQCDTLVDLATKGTRQQPKTTKTLEKSISPNNERINQTNPRGYSYRAPAKITGTFSLQSPPT